ncbi:MAG: glycosyltransferase [Candidatus Sumerlaeia bacterium]
MADSISTLEPLFASLKGHALLCPSSASHHLTPRPGRDALEAAERRTPVVSVVTPFYNAGDFFAETARSIRVQTVMNLEWIVIDDGSQPGQVAALDKIAQDEPRMRVVRQENAGPAAARNHGARLARTDFILFLDADDLIEPTWLEKALLCLASFPDRQWTYSGAMIFGTENRPWMEDFEARYMLQHNQCPMVSLVRKSAHEAIGGFDEEYKGHEDWDYWLRHVAAGHEGVLVHEFLEHHRYREKSRREANDQADPDNASMQKRVEEIYIPILRKSDHWTGGYRRMAAIEYAAIDLEPLLDPADIAILPQEADEQVLIISNHFRCGGADLFTIRTMEFLRKEGAATTVALSYPSEQEWLDRAYGETRDIFLLPDTVASAKWLAAVSWLIESRKITRILITQSIWGYHAAALLAMRFPHIPIFDYTHVEEKDWHNGGYPRLSGLMHAVWSRSFCNTEVLRQSMADNYGHDAEMIEVFRTGIDTQEEYNPENYSNEQYRRELGLPMDMPVILHISRLTPQKRPEALIKIAAALREKVERFLLLVVCPELALWDDFQEAVNAAGLEDFVRLETPRQTSAPYMAASDCFLLPSLYEGMAMTAAESLAMGLPVVASDVGGQRELFRDDVGWLAPLADPDKGVMSDAEIKAYVDALVEALDQGRDHRRAGAAARKRAVEMYALENSVQPFARRLLEKQWRDPDALRARNDRLAPRMADLENAYLNVCAASEHDRQTFNVDYSGKELKRVGKLYGDKYYEFLDLWEKHLELGKDWKAKIDRIDELEADWEAKERRIAELGSALAEKQKQYEELGRDWEIKEACIHELNSEVAELQSQVAELQAFFDRMEALTPLEKIPGLKRATGKLKALHRKMQKNDSSHSDETQ